MKTLFNQTTNTNYQTNIIVITPTSYIHQSFSLVDKSEWYALCKQTKKDETNDTYKNTPWFSY